MTALSPAEIEATIANDRRCEKLTEEAKWNLCAECNGELVVPWIDGAYQLVCGKNHAHRGTKPWHEHPNEKERRARQMAVDKGGEKGLAIAKYAGTANLMKVEAQEILETLWPDAPAVEVVKAAIICKQYGLNPLMRHIYLVGYENKQTGVKDWSIQIGIGATRMIARRSGAYSYEDNTPRLMAEAEQVAILGEVDKNRFWAITKLKDKSGNMAQGYGNWDKGASVKGAGKGNTPQNMAFIRSERAALDKLFPEKLPAGVGVVSAEYEELPAVDKATGEIKEIAPEAPVRQQESNGSPADSAPETISTEPKHTPTPVGFATPAQQQAIIDLGKKLGYRDADQSVSQALKSKRHVEWEEMKDFEAAQVINDWKGILAKREVK